MSTPTPEERAERIGTESHMSGGRIAREHIPIEEIAAEIREAEAADYVRGLDDAIADVAGEPDKLRPFADADPEKFARVAVQLTKEDIARRIRARVKEAARG